MSEVGTNEMTGLPGLNQVSHPMFTSSESNEKVSSKEQDRLLPIANVSRIMKQVLPENSKISKESKQLVQECASEFIAFITSEYLFLFFS